MLLAVCEQQRLPLERFDWLRRVPTEVLHTWVVCDVNDCALTRIVGYGVGEEVLDTLHTLVTLETTIVNSGQEGEDGIDGVLMTVVLVLEGCCLSVELLMFSFQGAHHARDLSLLMSDSCQFSLHALQLLLTQSSIALT